MQINLSFSACNLRKKMEAKISETCKNFKTEIEAKEAKHLRNISGFAAFRFEATMCVKRNRRTL